MQLRKEIIIRNFNRFAGRYEGEARLQLRVAKELIAQCADFSGTVLDLGAGPGIIAKNSKWDVISLDLAHGMCRLAGKQTVTADIEHLPFRNSFFANVISSLSLQWVNDFEAALVEINRVLKPGGKFAFTIFSPNSLKDLAAAFSYIDTDKHLMEFEPVIKIFARLKKSGFDNLAMSSQKITYNFPDMIRALHSIKDIGASYGFSVHKGLRGRKYFHKLENIYKGICKSENTVPLSWEVLYIHAEKNK